MSNKAIEVCGNDPVYTKPDVPCNCTEIYEAIDQLQEAVVNLEADKQGNLIAGEGIILEGNRISAPGAGSRLLYTADAGDHGVVQNDVENNIAGDYALAEGLNNAASGIHSHAEGENNTASGRSAHAEGNANTASGEKAHCEGAHNTASGDMAHAEGYYTEATQSFAHAEGGYTKAQGYGAHAEGVYTEATAANSHAEGNHAKATGTNAHAEGNYTIASGQSSHAEGTGTTAGSTDQHVSGRHNVPDFNNTYAEIIGGGSDANNQDNIRTLDWNGNAWIKGKMTAPSGYEIWDSDSSSMIDFAKYILEKYASTTLAGAAQTIKDALTETVYTVQAAANVTINRQHVYTLGKYVFVVLSFTTSASISSSTNLITGFPQPAVIQDVALVRNNAAPYQGLIYSNGALRFASGSGAAATYILNATYRIA